MRKKGSTGEVFSRLRPACTERRTGTQKSLQKTSRRLGASYDPRRSGSFQATYIAPLLAVTLELVETTRGCVRAQGRRDQLVS